MKDYIHLTGHEQAMIERKRRERFWTKLFKDAAAWFLAFLLLFGAMNFLGGWAEAKVRDPVHIPDLDQVPGEDC